jgi:hypothetical protein
LVLSIERCLWAMKIVKNSLRNKIVDDYMSHGLILFTENHCWRQLLMTWLSIVREECSVMVFLYMMPRLVFVLCPPLCEYTNLCFAIEGNAS